MKKINIICIIDKSGSMSTIKTETIEGFNSFLFEQQKSDYESFITLLLFNTSFTKVYDYLNINEVEPLTSEQYIPANCTSLLDAIGLSIDDYLDNLSNKSIEERCDKTLFVILTDGQENSSRLYHTEQIKLMIDELREEFPVEFIYLGANQDSFLISKSMGITNSMNFTSTSDGIYTAYSNISTATKNYIVNDMTNNLFNE